MKKLLIGLLLGITTLIVSTNSIQAAPVPVAPRILPGQSQAFENVIETGDLLAIAAYEINWNTDTSTPPAYSPEDALVLLTNYSNVTYGSFIKNPPYLPGGLVAFYLTATQVTDLGITFGTSELRILIQSNPTSFDDSKNSGVTGNVEWNTSASVAATQTLLENILPSMVSYLQPIYPDTTLTSNGAITLAGSALATDAFAPIVLVAPGAFTVETTAVWQTNVDPDASTPLETQINTERSGSPSFLGLDGLATGLGIYRDALGFLFILGMSAPIIYTSRRYFNNLNLGFAASMGLLVWWAAIGLMPIAVIFTLDLFMIAIIGVYIWRTIPVN